MSSTPTTFTRFFLPPLPNFSGYNGDVERWATDFSARMNEFKRVLEETPILPNSVTTETGTLGLTGTLQSAAAVSRAVSGKVIVIFSALLQIAQDGAAARSVFARLRRDSTNLVAETEVLTIPTGASTLFHDVHLAALDNTTEGGYTYDAFMKVTGGSGTANLLRRTLITLEPRE